MVGRHSFWFSTDIIVFGFGGWFCWKAGIGDANYYTRVAKIDYRLL